MTELEIKTGLWKKVSKSNLAYYSGYKKLDDGREIIISLFKNKKTQDKQPDLNIIINFKTPVKETDVEPKDTFESIMVESGQNLTDAERKEVDELPF